MRTLLVSRRWCRHVVVVGIATIIGAAAPASAIAQTSNPNVVEFVASPEHNATLSSGQPVVSRYDLIYYQKGATDALLVTSLGKPKPQADGMIRVDLTTLSASWPVSNANLEARVAAIGPNGTAVSDVSNVFLYSCSYGLSSTSGSMPVSGGNVTVNVTAGSRCGWTATSNAPWVTVTSGKSGVAGGTVGLSIAANTGASRSTTVSIAGQTYAVAQAGTSSSPSPVPTVQLTSPGNGVTFAPGASIQLAATASEPGGTIGRVDFLANGSVIKSVSTSPYSFAWTPGSAGSYTLQAIAYDTAGASAKSATVAVSVSSSSTPSTTTTYLSDMTWTSASNGWGPVEKDRSNGEDRAGDGRVLTLNGVTYSKGLGVHGQSTVAYALNGACSTFQANVGVDDEVGASGSVVFQVWADGAQLFDSGAMNGNTATKTVSVNVAGRKQLSLVVTDGGNGNAYDHGDWANARVTCTAASAPTQATYLSDLSWTSATNGWGPVEKDASNGEDAGGDGRVLTLNGITYSKGLGTHGNSTIVYALNGACSTFQSDIGVDDEVGPIGSVVFQVWADGVQLFDSGAMNGSTATRSVSVSVAGRKQLSLVVTDGGDGNAYDHADWANARVSCTTASATRYVSDLTPVSATSGWGPIETDRSNGEQAAGDGRTLTLNGQTFAKGLGVHSASDVRYALNNACSAFRAQVGVDDETGSDGTVVFQVWADGVKLFDSGVMNASSATQSVDVSVSGRNQLALIVTDAGDGNAHDHADWADARLTCQ
jgi:hypothetical protein